MDIAYRQSQANDIDDIHAIIDTCFGYRDDKEVFKNVENGRYLCAVVDNKVIAITGAEISNYGDKDDEFDWTGCLPEFRHQGIITGMMQQILDSHPDIIWYSAWRSDGIDGPSNILHRLGFEKVLEPRATFKVHVNCDRNKDTCVKCTGDECTCCEDLWVIHRNKEKN